MNDWLTWAECTNHASPRHNTPRPARVTPTTAHPLRPEGATNVARGAASKASKPLVPLLLTHRPEGERAKTEINNPTSNTLTHSPTHQTQSPNYTPPACQPAPTATDPPHPTQSSAKAAARPSTTINQNKPSAASPQTNPAPAPPSQRPRPTSPPLHTPRQARPTSHPSPEPHGAPAHRTPASPRANSSPSATASPASSAKAAWVRSTAPTTSPSARSSP